MDTNERKFGPAAVLGLCGALLVGLVLGTTVIPWAANRIEEARRSPSSVLGNVIDVEDLKGPDGKFVILEYPAEAAAEYAQVGDLDGLVVEPVEKYVVTEEDIEDNIRSWAAYYGKETDVTEGVVAEGDRAYMKYSASKDGEALEGYSSDGAVIMIGSADEPEGFSEAVVGMAVGEKKSFKASFQDDWPDEDVAGTKDVDFEVEILSIKAVPELTDGSVTEFTDGMYESVADFRAYIRESLEAVDAEAYESEVYAEIQQALFAASSFRTMPVELLRWYASVQMYYYQMEADKAGVTVEAYLDGMGLGDDPERVANAIADSGKEAIQGYALLTAVADEAGITVDDEADFEALEYRKAELMSVFTALNPDEATEQYTEANVKNDVRNEKTIKWLVENVRQEHMEDTGGSAGDSGEPVEKPVESVENEGS